MTPVEPDMLFCGDTREGAATGLLALMTGISEEFYCAGWLNGLEFSMWAAAHADADFKFGMGVVTESQRALLRMLHEEAGGWWVYGDTGAKFLDTDEWLARIDAATAKAVSQ